MNTTDLLEEKDHGPDVQINFPESVMSRIEELMGETEQFDNADFSAVAYINRMFPTEQSLSGVEAAAARCEWRLQHAARNLQQAVQGAAADEAMGGARARGSAALKGATGVIADLASQVSDINVLASRSAAAVREITQEIKQLDLAKSNLTAAITALNHYHMLCGGVTALETLAAQRCYQDILPPLQAVSEVMDHFSNYRDIKSLEQLRSRVEDIKRLLTAQIHKDIKEAFTAGSSNNRAVSLRQVAAACGVLDALDPRAKDTFLAWFIDQQLQEYVHLFSPEEEVSWLPHVEQRYAWLKRHLLALEQRTSAVLPHSWRLSERIATKFCRITHRSLSELLASRRSELDVKLLLHALQRTNNMETLLHQRFNGTDADNATGQTDIATNTQEQNPDIVTSWKGAISSCFEPHLPLYVQSLEQSIAALLDRLLQEAKNSAPAKHSDVPPGGAAGGAVLTSCADLFLLYKKCLVQCAQLTDGEPMLQLCGVFKEYLRQYGRHVLGGALPPALQSGPASLQRTPLAGLLRGDDATRLTKQDVATVTQVITTAEYCLETTVHLELKLKEKINPRLTEKVDFTPEQDLFHKMISNCIQILVQDLELACDPALQAMSKISWLNFDTVGDQSSYISQIIMHLNNAIPPLRDNLASSRKYFTQFCIRFANSFIPKFIQNIYKCKPISTVGSEQLLLDTHMLKTALLEVPSIGSEVKRQAPQTYTKVVIKLMTKAEMILKLVMAPLDGNNVEVFVAQFVQLLPESTPQEFHKVLDMKGAKFSKAQMTELDALLKEQAQGSLLKLQGIK